MKNLLITAAIAAIMPAIGMNAKYEPTSYKSTVMESTDLCETTRRFILNIESNNVSLGDCQPALVTNAWSSSAKAYKMIKKIADPTYPAFICGYYYVDIPNSEVNNSMKFLINSFSGTSIGGEISSGDFAFSSTVNLEHEALKIEMSNLSNSGYGYKVNLGTAAYPTTVSVELAKLMLEGLHTCVNSDVYGYRATQEFLTNYYNKLSDDDKVTFNAATINDIAYTDDTKTTTEAATVTCGYKLAQMKANAGITSAAVVSKSSVSPSNSIWAAIIISAAAVATFTVAFITINSKKRKKE